MPVDPSVFAGFVLASLILVAIPGPTVAMVVGQALSHGRTVAMASVLGVGLGDLIAASLSLAGVGALLAASATAFAVLKWLGAAYLVYLGIKLWRSPPSPTKVSAAKAGDRRPAHIFRDAFLVTLFNPKGLVFFAAFVPQFVVADLPYLPQAIVYVLTFVLIGIVNAAFYARLATSARALLTRPQALRMVGRAGGVFLIGAGMASALARRPG
ncbi:LysE family translocator [Jiella marina]|uniref:LysE family translocator n=1 Tax=Jiella sp. LLJ827 TaxID=2917712 RepID=UPI00210076C3|nr:LysE family translocator [Jiella sp. LLJ827]MCQ0987417.1 LysE family translocator [Jiella sp. LLJ827]